jgi:protein-tyrosine phosphatase
MPCDWCVSGRPDSVGVGARAATGRWILAAVWMVVLVGHVLVARWWRQDGGIPERPPTGACRAPPGSMCLVAAPYRVMTVCTGNICRSPMAEVVLRDRFEKAGLADRVVVDSTGISDEEHDRPLDRRARRVLEERGYPIPDHRARQVNPVDLATHDLVLAMTAAHAKALRTLARGDVGLRSKVRMYRSFDPSASVNGPEHLLDVDDPWYGDDGGFEVTLEEVEAAADAIVDHVRSELDARAEAS